jgi:uncharacterized OB-fold protein
MSDRIRIDDPVLWPYWEAATRRVLVVQRCRACGHHQFHPRPFCLACDGTELGWVEVSGRGRVYSVTTVHVEMAADLKPPYQVALVELTEGPRLLAGIVGAACAIGAPVKVTWRDRADLPPLPCFEAT